MLGYQFPADIDTENSIAWYLREIRKLSWREIGITLTQIEEDDKLRTRYEEPKPFIAPIGYDLDYEFVWGKPPTCAICGRRIRPGDYIKWRYRKVGTRTDRRKKARPIWAQELIHAGEEGGESDVAEQREKAVNSSTCI